MRIGQKIVVNWYLAKKLVVNWELGTPISTLLNVLSGNDKEAYIEAGDLYTIRFLEL